MNRIQLFLLLLISGLALCVPYFAGVDEAVNHAQAQLRKDKLFINTGSEHVPFNIEIPETVAQQRRGLMFRKHMDPDQGMLFVQAVPKVMSMWMKNTPLSLDMLFVDSSGKIIYIYPNTTPFSTEIITYDAPVGAVLELPAGTAAKYNIQTGDQIEHSHFKS